MARPGSEHRHTIVVVDDSEDMRESLAMLLELSGHRVAPVKDGRQALDLMTSFGFQPCIILVDLIMPGMDGLSLRTEMLADPKLADIPTIAVTGHEPLRRQALQSGFVAAVLKPDSVEHLLALITQHCAATATIRAETA